MKGNSWLGIVGVIILALFVLNSESNQSHEKALAEAREEAYREGYYAGEEDAQEALKYKIREAYESGYSDGETAGQEKMVEYLWDEGENALHFLIDFCCPNPHCQAYIRFGLGDGPYIKAYRGEAGWEDYTEGYYFELLDFYH